MLLNDKTHMKCMKALHINAAACFFWQRLRFINISAQRRWPVVAVSI